MAGGNESWSSFLSLDPRRVGLVLRFGNLLGVGFGSRTDTDRGGEGVELGTRGMEWRVISGKNVGVASEMCKCLSGL